MSRLIDADKMVHYETYDDEYEEFREHTSTIADFLDTMTDEGCPEIVDAVPVVRCADCIRFRPDDEVWGRCTVMPYRMRKNDYCSYGVIDEMRKDGERG